MASDFETRVKQTGLDIFRTVEKEKPSLFKKDFWTGKIMNWSMQNEAFKTQMFRFVDVFPYLNRPESVAKHIQEYFCQPGQDFPKALQFGLKMVSPNSMTAKMAAKSISKNINSMGKQFIVGNTLQEAAPVMKKMRDKGFPWVMKILKEEVKSLKEEDEFVNQQIAFFDEFNAIQKNWPALGNSGKDMDWGDAPKCVMSVMVSSLYAKYMDMECAFEHSIEMAKERLRPILRKAKEINACLILDMEHLPLRELTLATYKSIMEEPEFQGYPHTGLVYQAYLRDAEKPFEDLLAWARKREQPMHIRLVKGAFWDEEVVRADQTNTPIPVFTNKYDTDAMFEKISRRILQNHDLLTFKCASHNIRSIAFAIETAKDLGVPENKLEFQMLYGMAENLRTAFANTGYRLRLYAPIGEVIPGMAYLVRRLLENTSNESFLRQSFAEGASKEELLRNPAELAQEHEAVQLKPEPLAVPEYQDKGRFENEPPFACTPTNRQEFKNALQKAKETFPQDISLVIKGQKLRTEELFSTANPNNPEQVLAMAASAGPDEVQKAVDAARETFTEWSATPSRSRCDYLFRAAEVLRKRRHELAALTVLEIGKDWNGAQADVNESIDFLEYYGREMLRLGTAKSASDKLGESSQLLHLPRGVAAVITPWNLPLPISFGTTAASLVTGNTVVYKPAPQAALLGSKVMEIFKEAGLPDGVLNFLSGAGQEVGQTLVSNPGVDLVVFTGSCSAGEKVQEMASRPENQGKSIKKTILSLIGKNAIIMDSDADLDAAVDGVVGSAFGYMGQKCSACSRLIVLEENYDKTVEKVKAVAESLNMGPVEDPINQVGAVIDAKAQERIQKYIQIGQEEGTMILEKKPAQSAGHVVPLTIFTDIKPEHRLAREEIFGPILSVLKARDFDHALEMANSTDYALTGGIFSRSPANIEKSQRQFKVGNLYINRAITGALVGRHPFGGFNKSGDGSKAGGPDYLQQFMVTKTVVENTFRSGFAPLDEG